MDEEVETYVSAKTLSDLCVDVDISVFELIFCLVGLQVPIDKDDPKTKYDLALEGIAIGGKIDPNTGRIYYPVDKLNQVLDKFIEALNETFMQRRIIFLAAAIPNPDGPFAKAHPVNSKLCKSAIRALVRKIADDANTFLVCACDQTVTSILEEEYEALGKERSVAHSFFSQVEFPREWEYINLFFRRASLFKSYKEFYAGVFIGGDYGMLEEYDMFRFFNPETEVIPVANTGGIAKVIYDNPPYDYCDPKIVPFATSSNTNYKELFDNCL